MTLSQITLFAILGAALALFAWGRVRYDVVAVLALLTAVLAVAKSNVASRKGKARALAI